MNSAVLNDFIQAQNPIYPMVLQELAQGKKRTHWMWFNFPQFQGVERSGMAQRFAIDSLAQAQAYIQHPVLGIGLRECAELLLAHPDKNALEVFGKP